MKQYKTTVGEDVAVQFYQKITGGVKDIRFGTKPELTMKQQQRDFSVQADLVTTTSFPEVSMMENSQPNLTLEPTGCSTPGTPSRKKKKRNNTDSNYCGICNIQYGSRMDNDYGSLWINCSAKSCKYWVHLFCIGLSCKDENEEVFAKITKYYCKRHNPHKIPWPKRVLKNT